jgi:hypothetical protein
MNKRADFKFIVHGARLKNPFFFYYYYAWRSASANVLTLMKSINSVESSGASNDNNNKKRRKRFEAIDTGANCIKRAESGSCEREARARRQTSAFISGGT